MLKVKCEVSTVNDWGGRSSAGLGPLYFEVQSQGSYLAGDFIVLHCSIS